MPEIIQTNPKVLGGMPVIKGTRIMVANILSLVAGGYDIQKILEYYPELKRQDVEEAIKYAINTVQEEELIMR